MGDDGERTADGMAPAYSPPPFPWLWLLPGVLVLAALAVWGVIVYPELPDRVPQHFGPDGVDAYAAKSVGSVFLPVFVHAGLLIVMAGIVTGMLRTRPVLPASEAGPGARFGSLVNRPATRAGSVRMAKATLLTTFGIGVTLLLACGVMWQTGPWSDPPGWYLALSVAPALLGTVPGVVVGLRDKAALRDKAVHGGKARHRDEKAAAGR